MTQAILLLNASDSLSAFSRGAGARILGGSAWVLAGRVVFGVAVVLQNIVFARVLGPAELGAFLLAQGLALPAAIFAVFGLDLLAVRDLRDPQGSANRVAPMSFLTVGILLILTSASVVVATMAVVLWGACTVSAAALECGFVAAVTPALWPLVFLLATQLMLGGILRALGRMAEATFLAGVLSTFLLLCATSLAFALQFDLGLRALLAMQILALAVAVALSLRAVNRVGLARRGGPASFTAMARVGPALMLTQLLSLLVSQSDVWVFGLTAEPAELARYGVAARLAQVVSLPHLVLNSVLPPLMAAYLADGRREKLETLVRASVAIAAVPSVALGLAFAAFGRETLDLAFGPFYGAAAGSLAILAIGNVVNVVCGPCSQLLIMAGRQTTLNRITAVNCILCVGDGLLAAPWLGAPGIAAVYALGLSLQGIMGAAAAARLVGVRSHAGPLVLLRAARSGIGGRRGAS